MKVYLSGPITGLTPKQAREWREYTSRRLVLEGGFEVRDPLRGTESLHPTRKKIVCKRPPSNVAAELSDKAFVLRDYFDVLDCGITFCNLLNSKIVSIGSVCEAVVASQFRRLVIIVMEKKGNVHDHPFIREAGIRFHDLDQAIEYTLTCGGIEPEIETLAAEAATEG